MLNTESNNLSKEAIASRMFRNAARFWGLNDTNMDNFDPLVRLLVEACAVEVYRIDNEIASLQRVMTERLADLLIPEVHIQPRPAHAVIHAAATDEMMYVALESQFLHQKRIASVVNGPLDKTLDVFFSPAGRFKTISGDVAIIAAASNVYKLNNFQQKETYLRPSPGRVFPAQTIWVGIRAERGQDLTDLSIFFDLKNIPDKFRYLSMLGHVQCSFNGVRVNLTKGLSQTSYEDHELPFEDALEELYINRRLERQINRIYSSNFLTISAGGNEALQQVDSANLKKYPTEFEQYLGAAELGQLTEQLLWLKLELPPEFTTPVIDDLSISINCFPVVNRHLNELNYRLNSYFNIIPLLSSEQFFAVKHVEGTIVGPRGRNDYVYYPFDQYNDVDKGIYTVRVGDLERFDSRNAAEYINYLMELLRDESRAFAAFGQDFMATAIKDLNQNIGLIEQKIKQNLHLLQTTPTYLLINPLEDGDTIFVQYWTCAGAAGNGIRSGSQMDLYEGSSFAKRSLVLMTQSTGGMDKLKNTEILTAFKSVLLSRNRIVTAMDIKNFCTAYLLNKVSDVKVEKGVGLSPMPNQGLIPLINVKLTPSDSSLVSPEEWERIKVELIAELQSQSAIDVTYQVQI
ncbi:MAG: hypothetical protein ABI378_04135 [Chitinophagaceae bacterium]